MAGMPRKLKAWMIITMLITSEGYRIDSDIRARTRHGQAHDRERAFAQASDRSLSPSLISVASSFKDLALLLLSPNFVRAFANGLPGKLGIPSLKATMPLHEDGSVVPQGHHAADTLEESHDRWIQQGLAGVFAAVALAPSAAIAAAPVAAIDKSGFIGGIGNAMQTVIEAFHSVFSFVGLENSYGFCIILFTALIKVLTFPLLKVQLTTTRQVEELRPVGRKAGEILGGAEDLETRVALSKKLYEDADVNLLLAVAPTFAQIPIYFGLSRALKYLYAEGKLNEPFLFIPDLAGPRFGASRDEAINWLTSVFSGNPTLGWDQTGAYVGLTVLLFVIFKATQGLLVPERTAEDIDREVEEMPLSLQGPLGRNIVLFLRDNWSYILIAYISLVSFSGLTLYFISNGLLTTIAVLVAKSAVDEEVKEQAKKGMMANAIKELEDALEMVVKAKEAEAAEKRISAALDKNADKKAARKKKQGEKQGITDDSDGDEAKEKPEWRVFTSDEMEKAKAEAASRIQGEEADRLLVQRVIPVLGILILLLNVVPPVVSSITSSFGTGLDAFVAEQQAALSTELSMQGDEAMMQQAMELKETLQQNVESAQPQAGTIAQTAVEVKESVAQTAVEVKESVAQTATEVKESVAQTATDVKESITQTATDVKESMAQKATDVRESMAQAATEVK